MIVQRHNQAVLILGANAQQTADLKRICQCPGNGNEDPTPMLNGQDGYLIGPPGLWHRVKNYIETWQINTEWDDMRTPCTGNLERPDWTLLYPLVERELKAVLATGENGTIIAPTGSGKSRIVATLLDFIGPKTKGLIIGGSTTETQQLFDELKKLLPFHQFGLRTGQRKTPPATVMVSTVESAERAIRLEEIQFLIADEAHKTGKPTGLNILKKLTETCRYRFGLTAEIRRYDQHEHWLEAYLGKELINIPYLEAQKEGMVAPMEVWTIPTPTAAEIQRGGWYLAICNQDYRLLEKTGVYQLPFLHRFIALTINQYIPEEAPTLICVEKIRQGEAIQKELRAVGRDIPILHTRLPAGRVRDLRESFKQGKIPALIATKILNTGFNRPDTRFVVNAIGMVRLSDTVQRSGRATRPQKGSLNNTGVVIDFIHRYHPQLENMWKKREEIYQRMGWTIKEKGAPQGWKLPEFEKHETCDVIWDPKKGLELR